MESINIADRYLIRERDLSLAKFYYKDAALEDKDSKYAWARRLEVAFLQGNEQQALSLINEMKARFPKEYYPWHIEFFMCVGRSDDEAEQLLEQAKNYFEDCMSYQYDRFIFLAGTGRHLEAIAVANTYLYDNDSVFDRIAEELSDVYVAVGDIEKAENVLQRAIKLSDNTMYVIKLVQLKMANNNIEAAKKICDNMIDEDFKDPISEIMIKAMIAFFEDDEVDKRKRLELVIESCKASTLEYPMRICTDLLCAVSYYVLGMKESAIEILDFIDVVTDTHIKEIDALRGTINNENVTKQEQSSLELYIWNMFLDIFVKYTR